MSNDEAREAAYRTWLADSDWTAKGAFDLAWDAALASRPVPADTKELTRALLRTILTQHDHGGEFYFDMETAITDLLAALEAQHPTTQERRYAVRMIHDHEDLVEVDDLDEAMATRDSDKAWCSTLPREIVTRTVVVGPWLPVPETNGETP